MLVGACVEVHIAARSKVCVWPLAMPTIRIYSCSHRTCTSILSLQHLTSDQAGRIRRRDVSKGTDWNAANK